MYFFDIFKEVASIQFDIDIGVFATNVTKLERMIRDADAFIGIYPYDENLDRFTDKEKLLAYSRYFRLELNIALRSKKPAIIFVDRRYRNLLQIGEYNKRIVFDIREIMSPGPSPSKENFSRQFKEFTDVLSQRLKNEKATNFYNYEKSKIGMFLPENRYSTQFRELVTYEIENRAKDVAVISYPVVINDRFISELDEIDFAIIDSTVEPVLTSFLHGLFIPTLKVVKQDDNHDFFNSMFTCYEVGYKKDIVFGEDEDELISGITERMINIFSPKRRISTNNEAFEYFNSASLRKEAIFVSYSGKDADLASEIILKLKKTFQTVFDYRDGGDSIVPGQPWIEEIFDSLSKSSIGVPLYSNAYFQSGNCKHELNQMVSLKDNNKLLMIPIKIENEPIENLPNQVQDIQYLRAWEHEDHDSMIAKLTEAIDKNKAKIQSK